MSYCRTTLVEFNSEKDADEAQADYSKNAPSEFPEAENITLYQKWACFSCGNLYITG